MAESIFAKNIGVSDIGPQEIPNAPVPDKGAAAINTINTAIKGGLGIRDLSLKSDLSEDLQGISSQETIFNTEKEELEQSLLTSKDKSTVDAIHQQLIRLDKGQKTGALSPAEAKARKDVLLRSSIVKSPWLAADFRALASGFSTSGGAGKRSPEQKEMDKHRGNAVKYGVPLTTVMEFEQQAFRAIQEEASIKAQTNAGALNFPMVRKSVNNRVNLAVSSTMANMLEMLEQSPTAIDNTDWVGAIGNTERQLKSMVIAQAAQAASKGVLFNDTDRARLESDIDDGMAVLRQFSESKDKVNYLRRIKETVVTQGWLTMSQQNPMFALMIANGAGESAFKYAFDVYPKALAQVRSHGGWEQVEMSAALGDLNSIIALQASKFNTAAFGNGYMNRIKQSSKRGNSPQEELMLNTSAGSLLGMDNPEGDKEVTTLQNAAHNKLLDPDTKTQELGWYLQNDVAKTVINDPKMVKKLGNSVDFRTTSIVDIIPEKLNVIKPATTPTGRGKVDKPIAQPSVSKVGEIIFNEAEGKFVGRLTTGTRAKRSPPVLTDETNELNLLFNIKRKYGLFETTSTDWVDKILEGVNKEATLPAQEETTSETK